MALDERAFFTEKPETRQGRYQCPKCRRTADYSIRWVRRSKKDRLPPGADEADRAKFAKLRDYLLRLDDEVTCKTCGKKFEIPSQQSLLFVDQLAGLPNDEELEREIAAASGEPEPAPRTSRRCRRASRASRAGGNKPLEWQEKQTTEVTHSQQESVQERGRLSGGGLGMGKARLLRGDTVVMAKRRMTRSETLPETWPTLSAPQSAASSMRSNNSINAERSLSSSCKKPPTA